MNDIRIIYKIDNEKDKIKIFDEDFVKKYKDRYKIIYENKEHRLKEILEIKKIKSKTNKLEIKLKGNYNINEMKKMLYECNSLFSLPNISKWNKNNIFDKNQLIGCTYKKNNDDINKIKIVLLGNSVGKTCILKKYILNETILNQLTTIGIDRESKIVNIGNMKILLSIWDTPGQERFRGITRNCIKEADGLVFVLDITERRTLIEIEDFFEFAESEMNINNSGVICENKCDLEEERKITKEELKELGKKHNMKIFETSAITGKNINEAFEELIKLILKRKNLSIKI
jgi:small GTP-binding protein